MTFVTESAAYDRRGVAREAHRAFRIMRRRGWTFGDAMRFAWGRARDAKRQRAAEIAAFERLKWTA